VATSTTDVEWLAKQLYGKGLDKEALVSKNPLLAHLEHKTDFASANAGTIRIPVPISNNQGLGPTAATAAARYGSRKGEQFEVPQRHMYAYGALDGVVIRNALQASDAGQFMDSFQAEIDGTTATFGDEINQRLYGANKAGRALVHGTTAPSTVTLTLANKEDTQFFEPGMYVSAFDTATGTVRNSGAAVLLTKVDPSAGTLTGSTNWTTTIAALAVGDTLIRADFIDLAFDGLDGWVPVTPSASFLGVDQTVYRTRLAGVYYDGSNYQIHQAMLQGFAYAEGQLGGEWDDAAPWFMNPADFNKFVMSVEQVKIVDTKLDTTYNVGVKAIQVLGNTIVKDRHCPVGYTFRVPRDAAYLATCGSQPKLQDTDGKKFNLTRTTDVLEYSMVLDGNLVCNRVNRLGRIKLPA